MSDPGIGSGRAIGETESLEIRTVPPGVTAVVSDKGILPSGSEVSARAPASPVTIVVPLPPSYRGGTEEYAYRLAAGVSRSTPARILTTTVRWDPSAALLDVGSAAVERLPAREVFERPLMLSPRSRARLRRDIRSSSVVNLHMPFPLVEAATARTARAASVPLVLTYHMDADLGSALRVPGSGLITSLYRDLSAHPALDLCDAVVSNSLGYARASPVLSRHLSKVKVIPKGVDLQRLGIGGASEDRERPTCVPLRAVPEGAARLLFVGRLVPYKGISVLLQAMADLERRGRRVALLVAGKGPLREDLERRARSLGLDERVTFLGFVPDAMLGQLYRFADITVVPSLGALESSATTLEEAAACGCPVVGSDLPGAGETIPHDGLRGILVPPGDPVALANALHRLLDSPRPALPSEVRTWEVVVNDYLRLFRGLGARIP
jgi:glycosyltransferase involved in cell wall biosynthesis